MSESPSTAAPEPSEERAGGNKGEVSVPDNTPKDRFLLAVVSWVIPIALGIVGGLVVLVYLTGGEVPGAWWIVAGVLWVVGIGCGLAPFFSSSANLLRKSARTHARVGITCCLLVVPWMGLCGMVVQRINYLKTPEGRQELQRAAAARKFNERIQPRK